jgi:hypothetical protein
MLALTVHQPWAWLIARGIKELETRSWGTKHRGELAIHASVSHVGKDMIFGPAIDALLRGQTLQYGCIIAVARLAEVYACADDALRHAFNPEREWAMGHFTCAPEPKRSYWLLSNPIMVKPPIICRGNQGLWKVPARVEKAVRVLTGTAAAGAE